MRTKSAFNNVVAGQPGLSCVNDMVYDHCNNTKCCHANELLIELCGATWRERLFCGCVDPSGLSDHNDEILLTSLSKPDGPQVRLHKLLQQKTKKARLANRLVAAWQRSSNNNDFPSPAASDLVLRCSEAIVCNKQSCRRWNALRSCPAPLLVLLNLRLGCALPRTCCTIHCYLGVECPSLVLNDVPKFVLADTCTTNLRFLRVVFVGRTTPAGFTPLFTFLPADGFSSFAVSVRDSSEAAATWPMQLTALRASLCHRMYKYLRIRWRCPLARFERRLVLSSGAKDVDVSSAAFYNVDAAAEWKRLSCQLDVLYSARSTDARFSAANVSSVMADMAKLLPYACSKAVQRLMRVALLDVNLTSEGHYVYCLVSPLLNKLYVGAVGFKRPRSPYARLREHLATARCWASRASGRRYGDRIPALYKAIAKIGRSNIIQVILADVTLQQLASAERAFIRQLSPVFNILGVPGDIALPRAVQRLFGSSICEDVRMVAAQLLRHNRPNLPVEAWPALIAQVLHTGDRILAAKLARQARQVCPRLSKLRSAPRLTFPCPLRSDEPVFV